jgi:hypothetical protein
VTEGACHSVGWAYQRVGAVDPVLAAKVRWLSDYKYPRTLSPGYASALTAAFAESAPLMEAAGSVGDPVQCCGRLGVILAGLQPAPIAGMARTECMSPWGQYLIPRVTRRQANPFSLR